MARQQEFGRSSGAVGARVLRARVARVVARCPGPELVAGLLAVMGADDDAADGSAGGAGGGGAGAGSAAEAEGAGVGGGVGGGLSAREWVEVAAGWQRVAAFAVAAQLEALAALDVALQPVPVTRAGVVLAPGRRAADEVAPALRIAPQTASRLVTLARRAAGPAGDLHRCHDALARGAMHPAQLRVVAEVTRDLAAGASRRVQDLAVRRAPTTGTAALRAALTAQAHAADPAAAAHAGATGRAERDVVCRASPLPGCRRLVADLPTVAAQGAWSALNAVATTARDRARRPDGTREDRTLAQLRADALTAALTGRADPHDPTLVPTTDHLATLAEIQVVVTAETLLTTDPTDNPHPKGPSSSNGSNGGGNGSGGGGSSGGGGGGRGGSGDGGGDGRGGGGGSGGGGGRTSADRAALPATIPGAGVLDAAETRRIAATTTWRRLLADATTGTLLAYGTRTHPPPRPTHHAPQDPATAPRTDTDLRADPRWHALRTDPVEPPPPPGTGYRPPPALRRHVHTRDTTCAGPACTHPARGTQLDHTIPWTPTPSTPTGATPRTTPGATTTGGATTAANLASLCRRSHNAKTHGGWTLTQTTPGTLTWTSPTARTYHRPTPPLVTGWPGPAH